MRTVMDKDRLAAFVDGELSPEEAAAVVLHLADHPGDQAHVDDLFAANEALIQAFAAPLHEPVPEAIRAAIIGPAAAPAGHVVAFRPRRIMALGGLALAASIAVAAVLLPGLVRGPVPAGIALGPLPAADPVAAVLDTRASGTPVPLADGRETMVLASFDLPDGQICREFEVIDRQAGRIDYAIGCRSGAGWSVTAAIAEAIGSDTGSDTGQGFVPAGDVEADALTRYLERSGVPAVLDPAAEAEAIRRNWSANP
jgi:Putative zinc-finger